MEIKMNVLNPFPVYIGHEGESNVEQVIFDYSAWFQLYGEGVLNMVILRPLEHLAYPVILTDNGDNTATWTISEADTATVGTGRAQLVYYPSDGNKKTCVFDICIGESIFPDGETPDEYESWLETLMQIGSGAQQSAAAAAQSAQAASGSAMAANRSAQAASDSATAADKSADDAAASAEEAERILNSKVTGAGLTLAVNDGVAILTY